jgi:hypothetical protein
MFFLNYYIFEKKIKIVQKLKQYNNKKRKDQENK